MRTGVKEVSPSQQLLEQYTPGESFFLQHITTLC